MIPVEILVRKLRPTARIPAYETELAAGMDLVYAGDAAVIVAPGKRQLLPTGIAIALPDGYEAQVRPRSGLAIRHGLTMLNTPGTIDADYRGEIQVILINHGQDPFEVPPGLRLAQLVVAPVVRATLVEVEELPNSERGEGGFGSTGT